MKIVSELVYERLVVLPLVSRFFWHLASSTDRFIEISRHFKVPAPKDLTIAIPSLAWVLLKKQQNPGRSRSLLEHQPLICRNPEILPLLRGKLSEIDSGHGFDFFNGHWKVLGNKKRSLEYSCKPGKHFAVCFKLIVENGEERQSWTLKTSRDRFGRLEGGSEGLKRISNALEDTARILKLSSVPEISDWVQIVALTFDQGLHFEKRANGWNLHKDDANSHVHMKKFILESCGELRIKTKGSMELSGSMDVGENEEFMGLSRLTGLRWKAPNLVEFFTKHGLEECVPVILSDDLTGRHLLESPNYSVFVPPGLKTAEIHELTDKIRAVKERCFGQ